MSREEPLSRAPRLSIRLGAEIRLGELTLTGTTRDISAGGVCVELDREIEDGTSLEVTLFVVEDDIESADQRTLSITGRVQWSAEGDRGYSHGLKFVDPDTAKLAALGAALKRLGIIA